MRACIVAETECKTIQKKNTHMYTSTHTERHGNTLTHTHISHFAYEQKCNTNATTNVLPPEITMHRFTLAFDSHQGLSHSLSLSLSLSLSGGVPCTIWFDAFGAFSAIDMDIDILLCMNGS